MSDQQCPEWTYRFPPVRPEVEIGQSQRVMGMVDCRELLWWFVVPEVGNHTAFASYEADTLELEGVVDMVATVPARVGRVDCVEIQVRVWCPEKDHRMGIGPGLMYGTVGEDKAQWVAIVQEMEGRRRISTLADEGFEADWGVTLPRRLRDGGRFREQADGSYKYGGVGGAGAGAYDVRIGATTYHCLRVLDFSEKGGELVEAYIEPGGRTVFFRRYDGRSYRGTDLVEKYPENRRITIDGVEYVHCDCSGRAHDIVTSAALGLGA